MASSFNHQPYDDRSSAPRRVTGAATVTACEVPPDGESNSLFLSCGMDVRHGGWILIPDGQPAPKGRRAFKGKRMRPVDDLLELNLLSPKERVDPLACVLRDHADRLRDALGP